MGRHPTWVLCLVCTYGTPVSGHAGTLTSTGPPAHRRSRRQRSHHHCRRRKVDGPCTPSPCLRVPHSVRLLMPVPDLQKLNILAMMHAEFPMLERFYVAPLTKHNMGFKILPETSQAPHLRHLILRTFVLSIRSPLLTNAGGLCHTRFKMSVHLPPSVRMTYSNDFLLFLSWRHLSSPFIPLFRTALRPQHRSSISSGQ